jgi:hypothetical protein
MKPALLASVIPIQWISSARASAGCLASLTGGDATGAR